MSVSSSMSLSTKMQRNPSADDVPEQDSPTLRPEMQSEVEMPGASLLASKIWEDIDVPNPFLPETISHPLMEKQPEKPVYE